jgi:hypothetical protein
MSRPAGLEKTACIKKIENFIKVIMAQLDYIVQNYHIYFYFGVLKMSRQIEINIGQYS